MNEESNTNVVTETTPTVDFERRTSKREKVSERVIAYLITKEKGYQENLPFQIDNLSHGGVCLISKAYNFRIGVKYQLAIVFPLSENLSKIYQMDAVVRHKTNGKVGFIMVHRVKK